ncbi:MAG TPA: glycosyltransferase, partial [Alphaproteobacteria bacterium]|nr:glycosyltransferase [Alphaproteobacteria bacterium]
MPLTVLQVLPSLKSGGVERHVIDLVKNLDTFEVKSLVCSGGGELEEELKNLNVGHISLKIGTKNPFKWVLLSFKLSQVIKNHEIDLIHVHSRAPAFIVCLSSFLSKTPWISTYHGAYKSTNIFKKFYNRIMTKGGGTIAISRYMEKHIKSHHPNAVTYFIPEGIDVKNFTFNPDLRVKKRQELGLKEEEQVWMLPGRWTTLKGHAVFLKALELLKAQGIHITGLLVGNKGENSKNKNSLVIQKLLKKASNLQCLVLEETSAIQDLYQAVDGVVSCSLVPEAFGRTTVEALTMGLPFIGTTLGATIELCEDVPNAFLVQPGDATALASALKKVY